MPKVLKLRLDQAVLARGLAETREQARGLVLAGRVRVDGRVVAKAGAATPPEAAVKREPRPPNGGPGWDRVAREAAVGGGSPAGWEGRSGTRPAGARAGAGDGYALGHRAGATHPGDHAIAGRWRRGESGVPDGVAGRVNAYRL